MIGYGAMGKAHSYAYTAAPVMRHLPVVPKLAVIAGRHADAVGRAAASYGFEASTTRWQAVVERKDIDIVDICTPPGAHAELIAAAAACNKAVICEKPLGVSLSECREAIEAVRRAQVLNAICFNYRRLPAVSLMHNLVKRGEIGDVLLWRGVWLSDEFLDPLIPFDWRFDRALGGTTIADLGSHLVDLAHWVVGSIAEVCAQSQTFTTARRDPDGPRSINVSVDEASSALLRFSAGAQGSFEVARTCARRPCDFIVEVNGACGSLIFDYTRLNELRVGLLGDSDELYGMRTVRVEHPSHPYARDWWALGQGVGYGSSFVNFFADLLAVWPDGPWEPSLEDGLHVQEVCEVLERSVSERRWLQVGPQMGQRYPEDEPEGR